MAKHAHENKINVIDLSADFTVAWALWWLVRVAADVTVQPVLPELHAKLPHLPSKPTWPLLVPSESAS